MENKKSSEESQQIFVVFKEFINNIEESENIKRKISDILTLFKSIIEYLAASSNVSSAAGKSIHSLNESRKAIEKVVYEINERISMLENKVDEIVSISMQLAEITKKIPAINMDKLLKTLTEHADEINENTASIKMIKDKLK